MKLLLLLLVFSSVECYKVLLYSAPIGFSHVQLMASIANTLEQAGHEVVIIHPVVDDKLVAYWGKSAGRKVYVKLPEDIVKRHHGRITNLWAKSSLSHTLGDVIDAFTIQREMCEVVLQDTKLLKSLKAESFDTSITEIFGSCGLGLSEMFGIRSYVFMSSIGMIDTVTEQFHSTNAPSYVPGTMFTFSEDMTFPQRMINTLWYMIAKPFYMYTIFTPYEKMFVKYGIQYSFEESQEKKMNYFLVNDEEFLTVARPVTQRIRYIGGVTLSKPGTLDEKFTEILSRYPKTVLISFGSIAKTSNMPERIKQAILNVARIRPQVQFIWKTDETDLKLGDGNMNLVTSNWLPQKEILTDDRVALFVSHGGLNGILETTRAGKPAILVPLFGDQFKNAGMLMRKNTSIMVSKDIFDEETFGTALDRILNDDSYLKRAVRLGQLIRNRKQTPSDRLIEAVEYTAQFGRIHDLDVHGYSFNFIKYYCIDVVFVLSLIVFATMFLVSKCFKLVFCRLKKQKSE